MTNTNASAQQMHSTVPTEVQPLQRHVATESALSLTQAKAATLLGVNRTTIWRFTKMGILRPQEISPGTFRIPREQVETLARYGYRAMKQKLARR